MAECMDEPEEPGIPDGTVADPILPDCRVEVGVGVREKTRKGIDIFKKNEL